MITCFPLSEFPLPVLKGLGWGVFYFSNFFKENDLGVQELIQIKPSLAQHLGK